MNAHVEIEPRVLVEVDDLACSLDDQIAHLIRTVMVEAEAIAETQDRQARWDHFARFRDQQERVNQAFLTARSHVVNVWEERNRARIAETLRLVRTA